MKSTNLYTQEKMNELEELSKPIMEWIASNFDINHRVTITFDRVDLSSDVMGVPRCAMTLDTPDDPITEAILELKRIKPGYQCEIS